MMQITLKVFTRFAAYSKFNSKLPIGKGMYIQ